MAKPIPTAIRLLLVRAKADQAEASRQAQEMQYVTAISGVARSIADAVARLNFAFVLVATFLGRDLIRWKAVQS